MDVFEDIKEVALSCLAFDYRLQIERHAEASYLMGIGMGDCPYSDTDIVDSDEPLRLVNARHVWMGIWMDCQNEMKIKSRQKR